MSLNNEGEILSDVSDSSRSGSSLDSEERNNEAESFEEERDKNDPDLVLDLRNVPAICSASTEDENSEKLTAIVEQTEEHLSNVNRPNAEEDNGLNRVLRERICSLHEVMANLREELKTEVALWRKEREEFQRLRERSDILALEEATAAARAAAAAYAAESPLSNDLGDVLDIASEQTLQELTILEYERKLARYQDPYSLAQAEKRYNTRRQLIANIYKQKLMEVERLCDEELERIRQSTNSLQPLKEIASQWYCDRNSRGDSKEESEDEKAISDKMLNDTLNNDFYSRKIDAEVNMAPEIFVARFTNDGLKEN